MTAVAGVDWASERHHVLIEDLDGPRVWAGTVIHDEDGISELCATLISAGVVRVAVERPDGLLVERLLDASLTVMALHPNQVKAARLASASRAASPTGSARSSRVSSAHKGRSITPDQAQNIGQNHLRPLRRAARVDRQDRKSAHRAGRADPNRDAALGSSTIWAILRNPAYIGQAAYGRRRSTGEPAKPMRRTLEQGRRSGRNGYEVVGPEHWLRIPVPALISEQQYALAQELLARNSRLSPRNTRKPSLLQGILVCRECGHSYYRSSTRSKAGNVHHYYRCSGADSFRRPEGRVCAARPIRIEESTSRSGSRCSRCWRTPN